MIARVNYRVLRIGMALYTENPLTELPSVFAFSEVFQRATKRGSSGKRFSFKIVFKKFKCRHLQATTCNIELNQTTDNEYQRKNEQNPLTNSEMHHELRSFTKRYP